MLVFFLYFVAVFMETAIGVWVFSKIFPKRTGIEKRHVIAEWVWFTLTAFGAYSFPRFYWGIDKTKWYLPTLIVLYCVILLIYIFYKTKTKQWGKIDSHIIEKVLFFETILFITAQYWSTYESYSVILFGNMLPVLFLYIFYKCTLVQAYLWEFLYVTNLGLIKMVYVTYVGVFGNKHFEDFWLSTRVHTYNEIAYLLAVYFIILLLARYIPIHRVIGKILDKYKKQLFLVSLCEWVILIILMNSGTGKINPKNLAATLIVVLGIMILLIVLLARSFESVIDTERKLLDVRNEAVEGQYRELRDAYERHRCLVHDEKHMILFLRECLENGEVEDALRFLRNYQDDIIIAGRNSWTGISTLDFMVNIKKRKMDELTIHFSLDARVENIPMEDADFVVLLGNLFDNAIEAVEKCEITNRIITLCIQSVNQMFILKMRNTNQILPNIKNKRFITNKKNASKHGCGIESIKHILDKYNGHISFQYDETFFEASILINEEQGIPCGGKGMRC